MFDIKGIWCGKNATVAIVDDYNIVFLRIKQDMIVSILNHRIYGTIGLVYGIGVNFNAKAIYCAKNPETEKFFCNNLEAKKNLENHSNDKFEYDYMNQKLIYTMYDKKVFHLELAEKINMVDFEATNPIDNSISIEKRMALWSINNFFKFSDGHFNVGIDTLRYSIYFNISFEDKYVYCRVGQNGYCKKGKAMLSPICIRQNECRMIENNLLSMNEYQPMEECFVADGCAFPSDGGWYWSIKEVTDDIIYLYGCGGATYEIHRLREKENDS